MEQWCGIDNALWYTSPQHPRFQAFLSRFIWYHFAGRCADITLLQMAVCIDRQSAR